MTGPSKGKLPPPPIKHRKRGGSKSTNSNNNNRSNRSNSNSNSNSNKGFAEDLGEDLDDDDFELEDSDFEDNLSLSSVSSDEGSASSREQKDTTGSSSKSNSAAPRSKTNSSYDSSINGDMGSKPSKKKTNDDTAKGASRTGETDPKSTKSAPKTGSDVDPDAKKKARLEREKAALERAKARAKERKLKEAESADRMKIEREEREKALIAREREKEEKMRKEREEEDALRKKMALEEEKIERDRMKREALAAERRKKKEEAAAKVGSAASSLAAAAAASAAAVAGTKPAPADPPSKPPKTAKPEKPAAPEPAPEADPEPESGPEPASQAPADDGDGDLMQQMEDGNRNIREKLGLLLDAGKNYVKFGIEVDLFKGDKWIENISSDWVSTREPIKLGLLEKTNRKVMHEEMEIYLEPNDEPELVELRDDGNKADNSYQVDPTAYDKVRFRVWILKKPELETICCFTRTREQLIELTKEHDLDEWGTGCKIDIPKNQGEDEDSYLDDDDGDGWVSLFFYPNFKAGPTELVDEFKDVTYTVGYETIQHLVDLHETVDGWMKLIVREE